MPLPRVQSSRLKTEGQLIQSILATTGRTATVPRKSVRKGNGRRTESGKKADGTTVLRKNAEERIVLKTVVQKRIADGTGKRKRIVPGRIVDETTVRAAEIGVIVREEATGTARMETVPRAEIAVRRAVTTGAMETVPDLAVRRATGAVRTETAPRAEIAVPRAVMTVVATVTGAMETAVQITPAGATAETVREENFRFHPHQRMSG